VRRSPSGCGGCSPSTAGAWRRRLGEARAALESIDLIISEGELMEREDTCSFCGRTSDEARISLAAGAARICYTCVDLAREVIEIDDRDPGPKPPRDRPRAAARLATRAPSCGRDRSEARKLWRAESRDLRRLPGRGRGGLTSTSGAGRPWTSRARSGEGARGSPRRTSLDAGERASRLNPSGATGGLDPLQLGAARAR